MPVRSNTFSEPKTYIFQGISTRGAWLFCLTTGDVTVHSKGFSPHRDNYDICKAAFCKQHIFKPISESTWRVSGTLHDSLNLVQGNSCQGGKIIPDRGCEKEVERERGAHTLQKLLTLFSMEEPLSMFILIQRDSYGYLQPAYACISPRLLEPAPFIILQQPCSNWAASPPAVTHRLLHIAPEEI
ncbi:hypothetical protein ILYODFUR_031764 [Ilyodon furcidens]|uniref:Uncharacterized protein n=1 Tax=Ilyodon furcidens TaxID=33524 RepID=A0ABV0TZD6_9TELE